MPSGKICPKDENGQRYCTKCDSWKSVEEFHRSWTTISGYTRICKLCNNDKTKEWAQNNPDKKNNQSRTWRAKQTELHVEERKIHEQSIEVLRKEYKKSPEKRYKLASSKRKYRYRITEEQFQKLVIDSNGRCAICGETPYDLYLDHDHNNSFIRGLTCRDCNLGLGFFKDNPILLQSAITYLAQKKETEE